MKVTIIIRREGGRLVADPVQLLTAVPALLGFVPERSVVLMGLDADANITASMRHDLIRTPRGAVPVPACRSFARLGRLGQSWGWRGALALLVDDRVPVDAPCHVRTLRELGRAFAPAGGLLGGFAVEAMTADSPWATLWCGRSTVDRFGQPFAEGGRLGDPNACDAALDRAVMRGRPILRRRSELAETLTPAPHCARPGCAPTMPGPVPGPVSAADAARLVVVYTTVLERAAGERGLSCARLTAIAEALASVHVRDALIGLCLTVHREAAEDLWIDLARRLRGTPRAAAATLLGYHHYMEGSGAFASTAFEAAHEADPGYNLANLLDTALVNGVHPRELADLAALSFSLARDLGVDLPPRVHTVAGSA